MTIQKSRIICDKIKTSLTIGQVVRFYGVIFKGGRAICPLHSEKTPSFLIYPETQTFQCMGCKQGGDVIIFVSRLFGITNSEAAKKLNHDFNLGLMEDLTKEDLLKSKRQQKIRKLKNIQETEINNKLITLWENFVKYDKICIKNKPKKFEEIPEIFMDAQISANDAWIELETYCIKHKIKL